MKLFLAALGALAIALTGCGDDENESGGGGGTSGAQQEMVKVPIGTLPIANAAPMYIGMEKGFFRDEGIELEPKVAQSGQELITGLISDDTQFAFIGWTSSFIGAARGLPIKAVVNADNAADTAEAEWQSVMSKKGSGIRKASDLAGKTVGVNALKGVAEVGLKAALEKQGVAPSSVKLLEVPFPESPAALDAGRVDAVWAPEPFLSAILAQGGHEVMRPIFELGAGFPNGTYITSEKALGEDDLVERFARAMNKSTQYASENPEEARAQIPKFTQIPPETAAKMRLPVWKTEIDREALTELASYSLKYKIIEKEVDVDSLIWEGAEG
jgi:NitT/TauT family transport system substrate-binding protein